MDKDFEGSPAMQMLNLTRILFFVNAIVWLTFAVLGVLRAISDASSLRWIISGLMVANAVVMFWLGLKIVSGQAQIFLFAILYMALNVVLSVTDQFGWYDFGILLLNLVILGLLFVTRQRLNQDKTE